MAKAKDNFNKKDSSLFVERLNEVIKGLPDRLSQNSKLDKSVVLIPFDTFDPKAFGTALFEFKKTLHEKFSGVDFHFDAFEGIYGRFVTLTIRHNTTHSFDILDEKKLPHNNWQEHFLNLNKALGDDGFAIYMQRKLEDGMLGLAYITVVGKEPPSQGRPIVTYWDVNPAWPKPILPPENKAPKNKGPQ